MQALSLAALLSVRQSELEDLTQPCMLLVVCCVSAKRPSEDKCLSFCSNLFPEVIFGNIRSCSPLTWTK